MQITVEIGNATLVMKPDATLPVRFIKEEAAQLVPSAGTTDELEVWLGPGCRRKLRDDLSLASQGVVGQESCLWVVPRAQERPPSPQEKLAVTQVTQAVDDLVKRGALHDCSDQAIHTHVQIVIAAALQDLVSTGKIQPWQDSGGILQWPIIRPEHDLYIYKEDELDQEFGAGHFVYGYFFNVNDIMTNVPHENKRCFGFYRLDASQWIKKVKNGC